MNTWAWDQALFLSKLAADSSAEEYSSYLMTRLMLFYTFDTFGCLKSDNQGKHNYELSMFKCDVCLNT